MPGRVELDDDIAGTARVDTPADLRDKGIVGGQSLQLLPGKGIVHPRLGPQVVDHHAIHHVGIPFQRCQRIVVEVDLLIDHFVDNVGVHPKGSAQRLVQPGFRFALRKNACRDAQVFHMRGRFGPTVIRREEHQHVVFSVFLVQKIEKTRQITVELQIYIFRLLSVNTELVRTVVSAGKTDA